MRFARDPLFPRIPIIDYGALPEAEHVPAQDQIRKLVLMNGHVWHFEEALALFDAVPTIVIPTVEGLFKQMSWAMIAARDATITVYQFGFTLEAFRAGFRDCPTLRAMIDHQAIRTAGNRFKAKFPSYVNARHAVAHSAELMLSSSAIESNRLYRDVSLPFGSVAAGAMVGGALSDRYYYQTIDGQAVYTEISETSLDNLVSVLADTMNAFGDMSKKSANHPF